MKSLGACLSVTAAIAAVLSAQQPPPANVARPFQGREVEWRSYAGDLRHQHYSPLAQIGAENFNTLEVAWRFKTDSLGPRPEFKLEGTPLMAGGVVYATGGTMRGVVALDGVTGKNLKGEYVVVIAGHPDRTADAFGTEATDGDDG